MKLKPQPLQKPRQRSLQSFARFTRQVCFRGESTELAVPKFVKGTEKVLKCQFTSSDCKFFNAQGLRTHMKCIHGIRSISKFQQSTSRFKRLPNNNNYNHHSKSIYKGFFRWISRFIVWIRLLQVL